MLLPQVIPFAPSTLILRTLVWYYWNVAMLMVKSSNKQKNMMCSSVA